MTDLFLDLLAKWPKPVYRALTVALAFELPLLRRVNYGIPLLINNAEDPRYEFRTDVGRWPGVRVQFEKVR